MESTCRVLAASDISAAAQLACLLEASAPKPGNVSPGRVFDDVGYEDFLASAAAIGVPLSDAGRRPLGATVRLAIDATARWTRSNTNLGMVLLLAPLARAAAAVISNSGTSADPVVSGDPVVSRDPVVSGFCRTLRSVLRGVLDATTVDDA